VGGGAGVEWGGLGKGIVRSLEHSGDEGMVGLGKSEIKRRGKKSELENGHKSTCSFFHSVAVGTHCMSAYIHVNGTQYQVYLVSSI
jgi:hypothetical protein